MTPTPRRLVATLAALTLTAALAACNDPGISDADSAGDGTLRLTAGIASVSSLNSITAQLLWADPALAKKHKLEITWKGFGGSSPNCWTAVISGDIDVCFASPAGATAAIAEGQDLRFVTSVTDVMSELVVGKDLAAKAGGPDISVEDRLRALKGKTVVTSSPHTSHAAYLDLMLDRVDMEFGKDVKALTLTDPVAMTEGIKNKRFDAAMWTVGSFEPGLLSGDLVRWVSTPAGDEPRLKGVPFVIAGGKGAWVDKNKNAVDALRSALVDAAAAITDAPDKSAETLKKQFFPDMKQDLFKNGYDQVVPLINKDGTVTKEAWKTNIDILEQSADKSLDKSRFDGDAIYPAMRKQG